MAERWTASQIPSQDGRTAVVTGANGGLGWATSLELARAGAQVVLACRDASKGEAVAESIRSAHSTSLVSVEVLDLASLDSIRAFVGRLADETQKLDILVNNAGVMTPPQGVTADGFQLQFGINHLGHFALTGLLFDLLERGDDARVVTMSSMVNKRGSLDFDDLQGERGRYRPYEAYAKSKIANLLFAFELERRLRASGSSVRSLAVHPGYTATNIQATAPTALDRSILAMGNRLVAQGPEMGALPLLFAATKPDLEGGVYVAPGGFLQGRGYPKVVKPPRPGLDGAAAKRLWSVSEELTGVTSESAWAALAS
jgi:NAD(P)-dependent dehydrogenase (short-subunit alcohol dehydrogenase family)